MTDEIPRRRRKDARNSNYHDGGKRGRCYFCPTRHDLEEHHIVPQRFGGSDHPDNVVTVCERCHRKLERLYDADFFEHFGIDDEEGERLKHRRCMAADCTNFATHSQRVTGISGKRATVYRCDKHAHDGYNPRTGEWETRNGQRRRSR